MVQLITSLPRYSDGEINRALIKEIRTGFELIKQNEKRDELVAAANARAHKAAGKIKGLRHIAEIPTDEYFRLVKKYGHAEVHSRGFMKFFQKKFDHLCPEKL